MTTEELSNPDRPLMEFKKEAVCESCKQTFTATGIEHPFRTGKPWWFDKLCPACSDAETRKRQEQEAEEARVSHFRKWSALCPMIYRTVREGGPTEMERLEPSIEKCGGLEKMIACRKGVLLRGDSGKGKTRIMWRIMKAHFDCSKKIMAFTAGSFERACRDAAGEFELTEWFDSLSQTDCLFIDDLGKSPWSAATTSTFFDVLEDRTSNGKPMYVTTNLSGESLLQQLKLEKDIGEPMLRRLREFCELFTL